MIVRITKDHWYRLGGFRNSSLFRRQQKNGSWAYYMALDR